MAKSLSERLVFPLAGITLVLCWVLFVLCFHTPSSQVLFLMGNAMAGVGILLIVLAMTTLRHKGEVPEGDSFTDTTLVVKHGVFSVVRHPLYLGWLLMYPAAMLVSQHWLIVIVGVVGIASMDWITRLADKRLVKKFGTDYQGYIQQVPRMNILLGLFWKLGRKD